MTAPSDIDGTAPPCTDELRLRALEVGDAARLRACFERCYGTTYPERSFYDEAALAERVQGGTLRSVVAEARTARGAEIVGHMGLSLGTRDAICAEAGNTVVDPRFRGQRLVVRLSAALIELCRSLDHVGFVHYPTTAHGIMQRLAVDGGGIETGVLLDHVPQETDYRDFARHEGEARLAVVAVYQPIAPAPARVVHPPPRYRALLAGMYDDAKLERRIAAPAADAPGPTRMQPRSLAARGLLRLEVSRCGGDLSSRLRETVAGAEPHAVLQVDLPLADPGTPAAVEQLRSEGLRFGALLPELRDGDVLRLQRVAPRDRAALRERLATSTARALLDFVVGDEVTA